MKTASYYYVERMNDVMNIIFENALFTKILPQKFEIDEERLPGHSGIDDFAFSPNEHSLS